ncbi:ribosome biogenesis GTPase Der [Gemmatimonadota bacterium]
MRALPRVAIIGRPNVGKSTLFNRLVGKRVAIVDSTPGVTRDRIYGQVDWNGRLFSLIDTAGIMDAVGEEFGDELRMQVDAAILQADVLLFLVDAGDGPTAGDEELSGYLRRTGKPVVLAINKADLKARSPSADFQRWGFEHLIDISALRGTSSGELLDLLIDLLPPGPGIDDLKLDTAIQMAVVGRPNVGKSSLVNKLAGEARMLVSEIAGTTRDPVDTKINFRGRELVLIDTAGLRRKMRHARGLDYYTMLRSVDCIERCEVAVLMIDAGVGLQRQELRVADIAINAGKGMVLAMNKWDLVGEKETNTAAGIERGIKLDFPHLAHVPLIFVSALTSQRIGKLLELAVKVAEQRRCRIERAQLDDMLRRAIERLQPPVIGRRRLEFFGCRQSGEAPPVIEIFCNHPEVVPEHYRRYLLNRLREDFPFTGTPIWLHFVRKNPDRRRAGSRKKPKST